MVNVRTTSGIRMRVNRKRPTEVEIASPAHNPASGPNAHAPILEVNQLSAMVTSAIGKRATQSLTPNSLKKIAISQYLSGDFSR